MTQPTRSWLINAEKAALRVLPNEEPLKVIVKAKNAIFLTENRAAKASVFKTNADRIGLTSEVNRITELGFMDPVSFHLFEEFQMAIIAMNRMDPSSQWAFRIFNCKRNDFMQHLKALHCDLQSIPIPAGSKASTSKVAESILSNFDRQLSLLSVSKEVDDSLREYRKSVTFWLDTWASNNEQSVIETDAHGNLFSTNVWSHRDGSFLLDPSMSSVARLFPYFCSGAAMIADMLLLHDDQPLARSLLDNIFVASGSLETVEQHILIISILTKILVRIRFAKQEWILRDDVGCDRLFDRRILDGGASGLSMFLECASAW